MLRRIIAKLRRRRPAPPLQPDTEAIRSILQKVRQGAPATPSKTQARSARCESIRQQLRLAVAYDEAKIDRLVAMERERSPRAKDEELHAAAYERWLRDNR